MPSSEHNALVDLFRGDPAQARRLLCAAAGVVVPAHATATVAEAALDQLLPTEFRADLVVELRDAAGGVALRQARIAVCIDVAALNRAERSRAWRQPVGGPARGIVTEENASSHGDS